MQNICLEQVFHYFNNIIGFEKAKKLTSVSLAQCICHVTIEAAGHDQNCKCYFFKCRIFCALLSALIERKRIKLLFFEIKITIKLYLMKHLISIIYGLNF